MFGNLRQEPADDEPRSGQRPRNPVFGELPELRGLDVNVAAGTTATFAAKTASG